MDFRVVSLEFYVLGIFIIRDEAPRRVNLPRAFFIINSGNGVGHKRYVCRIQLKPARSPRIITMEHSNHQGRKEQVYLIQWDIIVKNKAQVEIHISA